MRTRAAGWLRGFADCFVQVVALEAGVRGPLSPAGRRLPWYEDSAAR